MNKLVLILLLLCSSTSIAQVATYTFTSADPGDQSSKTVTSNDATITASGITRGTGTTPTSATSSINASGWNSATQDANDYYEFTLTPNASYQLTLTAITISVRRSGSGPINYLVAYSIGGGTETTATSGTIAAATTTDVAINTSLSISTAQAVRFRVYAWGASAAGGTFRLNNSLTVSGATPLPVKVVSFTGQSIDQKVVLNWFTGWEVQNVGFDILKSSIAKNFEKVGFVKGNATTQESSAYSFTDSTLQSGQLYYYYQLRQRNEDGSSDLSNIISVRAGNNINVEEIAPVVYPNPNQGSFTLSTKELDIANVNLYNSAGIEIPVTIIRNQDAATLSIKVNTPVPTGLYYLRLQASDGTYRQSLKIIVQ